MDIPLQFRVKIGVYDIIQTTARANGVTKARIVNEEDLLERGISELKSRLDKKLPVFGVDFKRSEKNAGGILADLLLMYIEDYCLIIQLKQMGTFPDNLGLFLSDKSICFVGFKIDCHLNTLKICFGHCLTGKGAEIRKLAVAVLQKAALEKCGGLALLTSENEIGIKKGQGDETWRPPSDWSAMFFSNEEVKNALLDSCSCFYMGKKLLNTLIYREKWIENSNSSW